MPEFLERKLKAEYGDNPHAIYGTLNKIGAMKGSKETAKGKAMEKKHEAKSKALHKKKDAKMKKEKSFGDTTKSTKAHIREYMDYPK